MMADEDDGPAHSLELHPKRTTSFGQRLRGGKHASAVRVSRSLSVLDMTVESLIHYTTVCMCQ